MTLVGCCSDELLSHIVYYVRQQVWILMNDKFGNYLLQLLAERGQQEAKQMIKSACLKNISTILTRKYPKFLLIKLIEMEKSSEFCDQLMGAIIRMDDAAIQNTIAKRDSAMLLVLIMSKQRSDLIEFSSDKLLYLLSSSQAKAYDYCKLFIN